MAIEFPAATVRRLSCVEFDYSNGPRSKFRMLNKSYFQENKVQDLSVSLLVDFMDLSDQRLRQLGLLTRAQYGRILSGISIPGLMTCMNTISPYGINKFVIT